MDTQALRLFIRAAERLNISAAGRSLGLAPAAASARLAKLEESLGADLLHRSTRKVSLSLEGAEFLPYAREIIAQEDAALAALGKGSSAPSGTLRFTAPASFAQMYIAPLLPRFTTAFPRLKLDMHLSDTAQDLIEGSFDVALRNAALPDSALKARKLADDMRILCAAPSYLAAHGTPSSPSELTHHKLIGFGSSHPRPLKGPSGEAALFDITDAALTLNDGQSLKAATRAGAGICAGSLWLVHDALSDGTLTRVLPDWQLADDTALWLLYPQANMLSAKSRAFMDFLLSEIGKAPPWRAKSPSP